jgi:hypothetical protein
MNHLREVLRGFGSIVNPLGLRHVYVRPRGGFRRDAAKLSGDWGRIGAGLKAKSEAATEEYGKPSDYGTSQNKWW